MMKMILSTKKYKKVSIEIFAVFFMECMKILVYFALDLDLKHEEGLEVCIFETFTRVTSLEQFIPYMKFERCYLLTIIQTNNINKSCISLTRSLERMTNLLHLPLLLDQKAFIMVRINSLVFAIFFI